MALLIYQNMRVLLNEIAVKRLNVQEVWDKSVQLLQIEGMFGYFKFFFHYVC